MLKGKELRRVRLDLFKKWPEFVPKPGAPMTCDTCPDNASCQSAFDAYNTHGDCLEDK
jgi:hypothetical protein